MSTISSDGAAVALSAVDLNAPRFQLLRHLLHLVGEFTSLASERTTGPQIAAGGSSQAAEDINVSLPRPQDHVVHPSPATSPVAIEPPVTAYDGRSIKIPYIRRTVYIFPDACNSISQDHRDRYPALKDIFQRNIEEDPRLSYFTRYISYELRLCGPCIADATPSIVVFCPLKKLKKLKSLLTQPHIKSQFEPETANSVRFGLFFWAQPIDMLALHGVTVVIPEKEDMGSVAGIKMAEPWSVHITDGDECDKCTATMSCMVQVAGIRFGLTAAHAFNHRWAISPETYNMDSEESDSDDAEYDTVTEPDNYRKATVDSDPASPLNGRGKEVRLDQNHVYIPPHDETSAHANLDWALLDLDGALFDLELEEARMLTSATAAEQLPIAKHLPQQCLDVLIITRAHPGVPATLYNVPSYIGGVQGSSAVEVWTVGYAPESNRTDAHLSAICKGDSGSLVIGAQSHELYGMVVAANPFGDIHIVPFTSILAQVKEISGTQEVTVASLPRSFNPSTIKLVLKALRGPPCRPLRLLRSINSFDDTKHKSALQQQGTPLADNNGVKKSGIVLISSTNNLEQSGQVGYQEPYDGPRK